MREKNKTDQHNKLAQQVEEKEKNDIVCTFFINKI